MKKLAVALASFCLTVATYAAYVGVMADTVTGTVAMPSLESRIGNWLGITNSPTTVAGYGITDAATRTWVVDTLTAAIGTATNGVITNEYQFIAWTNLWQDSIFAHIADTTGNPHQVSCAMIGAATPADVTAATNELASTQYVANAVASLASTSSLSAYVKTSHVGNVAIAGYLRFGTDSLRTSITSNGVNFYTYSAPYTRDVTIGKGANYWEASGDFVYKIHDVLGTKATNLIFSADSDGHLSGLDADTLDTYHASSFVTTSQFFSVTTQGVTKASRYTKVASGVTSDVPMSITLNGTNHTADTNGVVDLGSFEPSTNYWAKTDEVTNAVDLIARMWADAASNLAALAWFPGDVVTNAHDPNAWHKGDAVTGVVATAVDDYARSLASAASSVALAATPQIRKLAINGVTNDLTQDRSWTIYFPTNVSSLNGTNGDLNIMGRTNTTVTADGTNLIIDVSSAAVDQEARDDIAEMRLASILPYTNFGTTNIVLSATNGSYQALYPTSSCRVAVSSNTAGSLTTYRFSIVGGYTSIVTLVTNADAGYAAINNGLAWTNYNTNAGATNVFMLDSAVGQSAFNLYYLKPQ